MSTMFRPLRADEVRVRINTISEKYTTLLLYKDSRCDMDVLDETVGPGGWQRKHYECKGNLYCSVGICGKNGWVWKDDCGSESYTEKEKGEASDSFKRACTNWGIGRELYTAPVMKVSSDKIGAYVNDKDKWSTNAKFYVDEYEVTDGIITKLSVVSEYWARGADGKLGLVSNNIPFKCRTVPIKDTDKVDTSKFHNAPGEA